jgi:hypothetical protein
MADLAAFDAQNPPWSCQSRLDAWWEKDPRHTPRQCVSSSGTAPVQCPLDRCGAAALLPRPPGPHRATGPQNLAQGPDEFADRPRSIHHALTPLDGLVFLTTLDVNGEAAHRTGTCCAFGHDTGAMSAASCQDLRPPIRPFYYAEPSYKRRYFPSVPLVPHITIPFEGHALICLSRQKRAVRPCQKQLTDVFCFFPSLAWPSRGTGQGFPCPSPCKVISRAGRGVSQRGRATPQISPELCGVDKTFESPSSSESLLFGWSVYLHLLFALGVLSGRQTRAKDRRKHQA